MGFRSRANKSKSPSISIPLTTPQELKFAPPIMRGYIKACTTPCGWPIWMLDAEHSTSNAMKFLDKIFKDADTVLARHPAAYILTSCGTHSSGHPHQGGTMWRNVLGIGQDGNIVAITWSQTSAKDYAAIDKNFPFGGDGTVIIDVQVWAGLKGQDDMKTLIRSYQDSGMRVNLLQAVSGREHGELISTAFEAQESCFNPARL